DDRALDHWALSWKFACKFTIEQARLATLGCVVATPIRADSCITSYGDTFKPNDKPNDKSRHTALNVAKPIGINVQGPPSPARFGFRHTRETAMPTQARTAVLPARVAKRKAAIRSRIAPDAQAGRSPRFAPRHVRRLAARCDRLADACPAPASSGAARERRDHR
ncbi:hypothetical protein, partial [Burkholderia thailandensis]